MASTNNTDTLKISPTALEKFTADNQLATLTANQVKKVFGRKLNKKSYEHVRGLAYNLIINNPSISSIKLSSLLVGQVKNSTTLLVQEPKKEPVLKTAVEKNIYSKKRRPSTSKQKTQAPILEQIRHLARINNPTLSEDVIDNSVSKIVAGVETEAITTNPTSFSGDQIKTHTASLLRVPPPQQNKKSISSINAAKDPISLKVLDSIPSQYLKVLHSQKYQEVANKLADIPESLPTNYIKDIKSSSIAYRAIVQKGGLKPFLSEYERSYRYIYSQRPASTVKSSSSLFKRIWSQISGKGGFSNHPQMIIKTIKHFSPEAASGISSSLSNPLRSLISKGLGSPLKNGLSAAKTGLGGMLKNGTRALGGGVKKLALGAGKTLTSFLSKLTLSNPYVLGTIVLIFIIIGVFVWVDNYNVFTSTTAQIIPSGQGGGTGTPGIYDCDPETEDCPEPKCVGDMCGWPVQCGCVLSGPFGSTHSLNHLNAIDIMTTEGWCPGLSQGVYVTYPGVVSFVHTGMVVGQQGGPGNYGNRVEITTDEGFVLLYAHMIGVQLSMGQRVEVGDLIGTADTTGMGDEHLHFEIRYTSMSIRDVLPPEGATILDNCVGYNSCGGGAPLCIQSL